MLEFLPREAPVDEVQGDGELAAAGEGGLVLDEVEEELLKAGGAVGVHAGRDDEGVSREGFHAAAAGASSGLRGGGGPRGCFGGAASGGFLVLLRWSKRLSTGETISR